MGLPICIILSFITVLPLIQAFHIPKKAAPDGLVEDLVSRSHQSSSLSLFFPERSTKLPVMLRPATAVDAPRPESSPELFDFDYPDYGEGDEDGHHNPYCHNKKSPFWTAAISSDYYGDEHDYVYFDKRHAFFRFALGFDKMQVNESRMSALKHFRDQFGVNFDNLIKFEDEGYEGSEYGFPEENVHDGILFAPVVFKPNYYLNADSMTTQYCSDTPIVVGGWMMHASKIKVRGEFGSHFPDGFVEYNDMTAYNFFFVLNPGTPYSVRIAFYSTIPSTTRMDGTAVISGITYNIEDMSMGYVDGAGITYKFPGLDYTYLLRLVMSIPGRVTPMPK